MRDWPFLAALNSFFSCSALTSVFAAALIAGVKRDESPFGEKHGKLIFGATGVVAKVYAPD